MQCDQYCQQSFHHLMELIKFLCYKSSICPKTIIFILWNNTKSQVIIILTKYFNFVSQNRMRRIVMQKNQIRLDWRLRLFLHDFVAPRRLRIKTIMRKPLAGSINRDFVKSSNILLYLCSVVSNDSIGIVVFELNQADHKVKYFLRFASSLYNYQSQFSVEKCIS